VALDDLLVHNVLIFPDAPRTCKRIKLASERKHSWVRLRGDARQAGYVIVLPAWRTPTVVGGLPDRGGGGGASLEGWIGGGKGGGRAAGGGGLTIA